MSTGVNVMAKEAREEHGERLGKGKGLEQPAGLLFKGKDRKKAHGDHEERKEERGTDLLGRVDDHINSRTGLSRLLPVFQLFVRILDHDDRSVHHCADGYGDAGELMMFELMRR